jgi:soluble lytic murein transglycosylase
MPQVPVAPGASVDLDQPLAIRANAPLFGNMAAPPEMRAPAFQAPALTQPTLPRAAHYDFKPLTPATQDTPVRNGYSMGEASMQGQGLTAFGSNIENAGQAMSTIARAIQVRVDQSTADKHIAKQTEDAVDLSKAYSSFKGDNVTNFTNDGGQTFSDYFMDQLREKRAANSEGLNTRQKEIFDAHADAQEATFYGGLQQHQMAELRQSIVDSNTARLQSEQDALVANSGNPDAVALHTANIKALVAERANMDGETAPGIKQKVLSALSTAHTAVLDSKLKAGDYPGAIAYANGHKDEIAAPTYMSVMALANKGQTQLDATAAADNVSGQMFQASRTTDFSRLTNNIAAVDGATFGKISPERIAEVNRVLVKAVATVEGGGTEQNEKTSPKGAKGPMQVMPGTQARPGFGVRPAADDSPAERARVGRDYTAAMVKYYDGDVAKAVAAYNAGPGAVNDAVDEAKKSGKAWLTLLPAETQKYVPQVMDRMAKGGSFGGSAPAGSTAPGANPEYSLEDATDWFRKNDPRYSTDVTYQEHVDARLERRFAMHKQATTDLDNKALTQAYAVVDNGGAVDDLPIALREQLSEHLPALRAYEKKRMAGEDPETDWKMFYDLASNPDVLSKTNLIGVRDKMADAQWLSLVSQQRALTAKDDTAGDRRTQVQNASQILEGYMRQYGVDPNAKKGPQVEMKGRLMADLQSRIDAREHNLGRKMTPEEISDETAHMFVQVSVARPHWWSFSPTEKPLAMVNPDETITIAPTRRAQIVTALQQKKMPVNEQTIRQMYLQVGNR